MVLYSLATNKNSRQSVELLQTQEDSSDKGITFDIVQTGLSANNKFYLDFGEKPPFNFFQCYPIDANKSSFVEKQDAKVADYAHPPVWGLAKVASSSVEGVAVGTHYLAQLPMGEQVSFEGGKVDDEEGNLTIDRPTTNAAYNVFIKVDPEDPLLSKDYGALALVCFPGIATGSGLFFELERNHYYGAQHVVVTSASSKVGLALALYLKQEGSSGTKVIGYTSDANKEFCQKTGLYDSIHGYNDKLSDVIPPNESCAMIDIAGKASIYTNNVSSTKITKLFCIGNSSGTPDQDSTFACFSTYAKMKMILTFMGAPSWIRKWMNPTQELFLIMETTPAMKKEYGLEKYRAKMREQAKSFCAEASKWISVRNCSTEESIRKAFEDIIQGSVPPSEAVVLDVTKAVSHRKK